MVIFNKKISTSLIIIFCIFTIVLASSYAYFSTRITGNDTASNIELTTATVEMVFIDGAELNLNNITAGSSSNKVFRVENNTSSQQTYSLIWTSIANGFSDQTLLTYEIACVGYSDYVAKTISATPCSGLNEAYSPDSSTSSVGIISGNSIPSGDVQEYTVTFYVSSSLPPESIVSFSGAFGISAGTVSVNHDFVI